MLLSPWIENALGASAGVATLAALSGFEKASSDYAAIILGGTAVLLVLGKAVLALVQSKDKEPVPATTAPMAPTALPPCLIGGDMGHRINEIHAHLGHKRPNGAPAMHYNPEAEAAVIETRDLMRDLVAFMTNQNPAPRGIRRRPPTNS